MFSHRESRKEIISGENKGQYYWKGVHLALWKTHVFLTYPEPENFGTKKKKKKKTTLARSWDAKIKHINFHKICTVPWGLNPPPDVAFWNLHASWRRPWWADEGTGSRHALRSSFCGELLPFVRFEWLTSNSSLSLLVFPKHLNFIFPSPIFPTGLW